MLDLRRPPSIPPSELQGGILSDVALVGGTVAALYFAAYLYEIGFLWHLGLPISLAEVGFSRSLALVAVAAPAGSCLTGCGLRVRSLVTNGPPPTHTGTSAAIGLGSLTVCVAALTIGTSREDYLDSVLIAYGEADFGIIRMLVFFGGIGALALYYRHASVSLARSECGRIALSSLLVLLLFALAVGLGWRGAELKERRSNSFLYLSGSDFALVRLYPDKALFLRYDPAEGKFASDYRVRRLDYGTEGDLARDLEVR